MFTPDRCEEPSRFFDVLQSDAAVVAQLAPAIMRFYVDAEAGDFFARLSMRNHAQLVLKVPANPVPRIVFTRSLYSPFVRVF